MKTKEPLLTGLSHQLYGRSKRSQQAALGALREQALSSSISDPGVLFQDILPVEDVLRLSPDQRRRVYPQAVTFWAWTMQLLSGNGSCSQAVSQVQNWCAAAGVPEPQYDSSGYCKARGRLDEEFLGEIDSMITTHARKRVRTTDLWHGLRPKAIDGTSIRLTDTLGNQEAYPQPCRQKPGCGFPVMGLVGVLDLSSGCIVGQRDSVQNTHDLKGAHQLLDCFGPEDIMLGDRAFCTYGLIAGLLEGGTHSVTRLHQSRAKTLKWKSEQRLDRHSVLVEWRRKPSPDLRSPFTAEQWSALPRTLKVRLVRARCPGRDGKMRTVYLVTTLLDPVSHPSSDIAALYLERWKIEVKFRDIKTTLGLEQFNVRSPKMARKTLQMVVILYNLLKVLQMGALAGSADKLDVISFKATVDLVLLTVGRFAGLQKHPMLRARELEDLRARIRKRTLLLRPGRSEPRAVKLRPKNYQWLTAPRAVFRDIPHRTRYRKVR